MVLDTAIQHAELDSANWNYATAAHLSAAVGSQQGAVVLLSKEEVWVSE